jgi:hypothetical protein
MTLERRRTRPATLDMTDDEIREWGIRSRARQGLPPKITDAAVLQRLITLAFTGLLEEPSGQADGNGRPAP